MPLRETSLRLPIRGAQIIQEPNQNENETRQKFESESMRPAGRKLVVTCQANENSQSRRFSITLVQRSQTLTTPSSLKLQEAHLAWTPWPATGAKFRIAGYGQRIHQSNPSTGARWNLIAMTSASCAHAHIWSCDLNRCITLQLVNWCPQSHQYYSVCNNMTSIS